MYLGSDLLYMQTGMLHEVIEEAVLKNSKNNMVLLEASFLNNGLGQTSRQACVISFFRDDLMAGTRMSGHVPW